MFEFGFLGFWDVWGVFLQIEYYYYTQNIIEQNAFLWDNWGINHEMIKKAL